MPLSRYLVRNEYGLADPDLYKVADKDDPEALLEGVAMAGLVGVLRQLGDLAEFAAEMFHDLHEEVMGTAARGHSLIARLQQLEAEFSSAENTLLSQTTHIPFLYNSGVDWHPSIHTDENLVTRGDMPRFVMDSYEECRGPPRLFLLDKFDVAGAGACLKRYTDPSSFKVESTEFSIKESESQREKRIRKVKPRRGLHGRNGDTPEVFSSSHAKLHQLLLEERIETGANDPERRVKLKKRPLDGFTREDRLKSYMQKFMDSYSSDTRAVREISLDLVPVNFESYSINDSCQSGLEIVEYETFSPSEEPFNKDKVAYPSSNTPEVVHTLIKELNEVTHDLAGGISGAIYKADADNLSLFNKDVTHEELAADTISNSGGSVGEYNGDDIASEIDKYEDALATLESETETDSDFRTKRDQLYQNGIEKMIDSDGSEEKQHKYPLVDYHSIGNSTISDDGSVLKKDIDIFSSSDNVSSSAEYVTAKSSAIISVNSLADGEKPVTREAHENKIEEHIASDVAESTGKISLAKSEFTELPWKSVNALTEFVKERTEQHGQESKGQVVVTAAPDTGSDHLMPAGISSADEMADAGFESSSEVTSSHSHSEYPRDDLSTLLKETENSSANYPAKHINDLMQLVEATDIDGIVKPGILIDANSEDSFAPGVEPLCFENPESTEQLDSSENIAANSVDESSLWTVHESAADKTSMIGDDSSNLNLVDNLSQVNTNSQSGRVPEVLDALMLLDGEAAEAGILDSATISDIEGFSKSVIAAKDETHLNLDAIRNHNDCIATHLDPPVTAPASSGDSHLAYGAGEYLQAEEDAISFDDSTQHLTEVTGDLDLNHSVQVLDNAESTASLRHNSLKIDNTEMEGSVSPVLDCTSTGYEDSICIGEDPYQSSDGTQIQSLQGQRDVDLHNPLSCEKNDGVNSDSTACDTSSIVLRSADNLHETCLAKGEPSESSLTSAEREHHLERTKSSQYCAIEDKEHVLEALADIHTISHLTSDKTVEAQSVEITEESSNATSQPLEQLVPPEDSGHEMHINPIFASSCSAPLNKPSAATYKLQNTCSATEESPADFSSMSSHGVEAEAMLRIENPGQTLDPSSVSPSFPFGTFLNSTHITPRDMPPLPPLPPMQWRLGRNQQTPSLAFGDLMQNPHGALHRSTQLETSDNAGLRSQNSSTGQRLNPFLSVSDEDINFQHEAGYSGRNVQQPPGFMFPTRNVSHEDFTIDQRQDDAQVFARSQNHLPVPEFSFESIESGLSSKDGASALFEEGTHRETNEAHEQFEHMFSQAEQETDAVDLELEHSTDKETAATSSQFEPPAAMQYGQQLSHGFVAPEAQGMCSTDEYGLGQPENVNGSMHKKIQRPRNPLIDAVVAVDKSKLRKVGEMVKSHDKPEAETREQQIPQLRKVGKREMVKSQEKPEAERREQWIPQLRKVGKREKPQDRSKSETREKNSPNFPPLRNIGERAKPQDLVSAEVNAQKLPQLRKVEKRIKPQDGPNTEDDKDKQSFRPLKGVVGRLKPQDSPHSENKDWLEQIRNQSFNLKPPATSRPNIQGRQTNLKVTAILEKANMIRQAMVGTDDDSDGWSDN